VKVPGAAAIERPITVEPAPPAFTWIDGREVLSWGRGKHMVGTRNTLVYDKNGYFPESHVTLLPFSEMRGFKLARLAVFPVRYNPVSGEALFAGTLEIEIEFEETLAESRAVFDEPVADFLMGKVLNPEDLTAWYPLPSAKQSTYDYVIITTNAVVENSRRLGFFIAQKRLNGHSVLVVTEDDFLPLTGQAPDRRAEKIRQWLIDNYVTLGIEYVLLIGDPHPAESGEGDIPMKMCWPLFGEEYPESPTDYFYADLTGNWNLDGDLCYGEWEDDTGPGGVDYAPEVFVGRIPFYGTDYDLLDEILQKTMDYENELADIADWRRSALMPMSHLDPYYESARMGEQLKDYYLDPLGLSSWRIYQQGNGPCGDDSPYDSEQELFGGAVVKNRWMTGEYGLVILAGHGNPTTIWVGYEPCWDDLMFHCSDAAFLNDDRPSLTYHSSCSTGYPEQEDNLGFAILRQGAVGTVSSSRVAWYSHTSYGSFGTSRSCDGIGYRYMYRLADELDAGHALYLAKSSVVPTSGTSLMNHTNFNLYGDPSISIASSVPGVWAEDATPPLGDTGQGRGAAWVDYDGDGDLDLYVTNDGDNLLLRNDLGTFTDVTSGPIADAGDGRRAAWGDLDNDGDVDLYLVNNGANRLLRNDGAAAFTDVTAGALGDTGDGRAASWLDYDNDGDLDLYLVNNGANRLLRNDGAAAFTDVTPSPLNDAGNGQSVAAADYDNDGDLDLYVSNSGGANKLFRNDSGTFVDVTAGPLGDAGDGYGVAWGDYDSDGDLDLYLANDNTANKLMRNDGGAFVDATAGPLGDTGPGRDVSWADLDNDGDLDLYLVNYGAANELMRNDGGAFTAVADSTMEDDGNGVGVTAGDYDLDGDLDLYAVKDSEANCLLVNRQVGNHWLKVELVGLISNRSGIGAHVRAVAGGTSQMREISAGSGLWGQHSLTAEFGLGDSTAVDTLEVAWPSGEIQYLTDIAADQTITVDEPYSLWVDATQAPLDGVGKGRGVAWGDYDGDGDQDLYIGSYNANRLYRNDDTAFVDVTSGDLGYTGKTNGVAWADYDGDGDLDIYLANYGSANKLLRNDGGAFTDVTAGPLGDTGNGRGMAWGDYDGDGDLDLYIVNNGANVMLACDSGYAFSDTTSGPLADGGNGSAVAAADYDNDGDLDLYISNMGGANLLLRNEGGFTFTDVTSGPLGNSDNGMGVAWADYDGDGDLDIYLANYLAENKLFRNDSGAVFVDVTGGPLGDTGPSRGVAWADYDNDGDLDIYVTNYLQANCLLRNEGGGAFADVSNEVVGDMGGAMGAAWADYDGDGDLDLYVSNDAVPHNLFRNDFPTRQWLHVKLTGVLSNTSAIGARIRAVAGPKSQVREVSGGSGLYSQNSLIAEFGLGSEALVDTLEICWPSGVVQYEYNVTPCQVIDVVEDDQSGVEETLREPLTYRLYQNHPNPFSAATAIRYDLPERSSVSLRVYDVRGRLVRSLVREGAMAPGRHVAEWDGRDHNGRKVSAGVYFCRLMADSYSASSRIVLLR
jgi:hypothetical protein